MLYEVITGFTVVTGETGAGKTMVLTGLHLILGGKATPDAVRLGASEATAEAVLDVPEGSEARERALDAGASLDDDGTVTVLRIVGASTRSRAVLGGRTVPQALLGDVGGELVTVHGQSDQVRITSYNVCYTKLLRGLTARSPRGALHVRVRMPKN